MRAAHFMGNYGNKANSDSVNQLIGEIGAGFSTAARP